jgi:RHS repeat-associated protein
MEIIFLAIFGKHFLLSEYLAAKFLNPKFAKFGFLRVDYIGSQRIVSKIGNGRFDNNSGLNGNGITAGGINFAKQQSWYDKKVEEYIASLGIPPGPPDKKGIYGSPEYTGQPYPDFGSPLNESNEPPLGWTKVPVFNQPGDVPGPPIKWGDPVTNDNVEAGWGYEGTGVIEETDLYFYHPDHLGSTSYVTTRLGKVSQHVEYIPFGEVFIEEKNDKWNTPYKFNAKEMDEETGLYYYGARYYDSKVSVWISVDPKMEKYPNQSPYLYCNANPVNAIDPDGRDSYLLIWFSGEDETGHAGIAVDNYKRQQIMDSKGKPVLDSKGNPTYEMVKDGTMTYYDLWPNSPVNTELQSDVKPDYSKGVVIKSLADLKTKDPTGSRSGSVSAEGRAADGIVQINTTYEQDTKIKGYASKTANSGKAYNASSFNCSTFAESALKTVFPKLDASQYVKVPFLLRTIYDDTKVVAPNNLYNETMKLPNATNIKGAKSVVAKPYLEYYGK